MGSSSNSEPLKQSDHGIFLSEYLKELYESGSDEGDVILRFSDGEIRADLRVLSVASPFLSRIFRTEERLDPVELFFPGHFLSEGWILKRILYTGVSTQGAESLFETLECPFFNRMEVNDCTDIIDGFVNPMEHSSQFLNDNDLSDAIFIDVFDNNSQSPSRVQFIVEEEDIVIGLSGDNPYLCCVCDAKVLSGLMDHLALHTKELGPYQCRVCRKSTFLSGIELHTHTKKEHIEAHKVKVKDGGPYKCKECNENEGFTCLNAKSFTEHMVREHGKKPFDCEHCGARYMHKQSLEDHILSKHTEGGPKISCDKCGKTFKTRTNLVNHRRDQHELGDKRRAECEICGFISKGLRNLKKHKEIHDESSYKKYQCGRCPRMFRSRHSLSVHDRTHTGETPYSCRVCSVSFKRIHHLKSHKKSASHLSKEKNSVSINVIEEDVGILNRDELVLFKIDTKECPNEGVREDRVLFM